MRSMLKTPVGRLRLIAIAEGFSFLLLLFIAMPLKHFVGYAEAVRWSGWLHGILFLGVILALVGAMCSARWSIWRAGMVLMAALLPFGPFVIDHRLREAAGPEGDGDAAANARS